MPMKVNQKQVEQVWEVKRKNPNWSQRQIAKYCNIGRRTVQRYLSRVWLTEHGLIDLSDLEPVASTVEPGVGRDGLAEKQDTRPSENREGEGKAGGAPCPYDSEMRALLRQWADIGQREIDFMVLLESTDGRQLSSSGLRRSALARLELMSSGEQEESAAGMTVNEMEHAWGERGLPLILPAPPSVKDSPFFEVLKAHLVGVGAVGARL